MSPYPEDERVVRAEREGKQVFYAAAVAHICAMPAGHPGDAALDAIVSALGVRFRMTHVTLQVEMGTSAHCCALDGAPHMHP